VCAALPDDPVEGWGLETLAKRRVAPAGRNPTYQSLIHLDELNDLKCFTSCPIFI